MMSESVVGVDPAQADAPAQATKQPGNVRPNGGSRESSEFEFVEGRGGAAQAPGLPPPPAPLPTSVSPTPAAVVGVATTEQKAPPTKGSSSVEVNLAATGGQQPKPQQQQQEEHEEQQEGLFGWVRGASGGLLSKVAEKTKNSVETVITTLDPQMKDFIHSGGDVTVAVASDDDDAVLPLREAFQRVFGRATVYGLSSAPAAKVAVQPVGFAAGRQGAAERLRLVRGRAGEGEALVGVEAMLLEVGDDDWVELSCLLLRDDARGVALTAYTQPTPVDSRLVARAKDLTPEDYPLRWSGLAAQVGSLAAEAWGVRQSEWREAAVGVSARDTMRLAATALAGMYKRALDAKVDHV